MTTSKPTTSEFVQKGVMSPETAKLIEEYAHYIDVHGDVPPASSVEVREVGRPRLFAEDLVHVNARITTSQRDFVERYARVSGQSRSDVLRNALDMYRRAHESELADA